MKNLFILLCTLIFTINSSAQKKAISDSSYFSVNVDLGVSSRNIWRGLDYGSSPSIWGDFYGNFNNFSVGAMGTKTLNGSKNQYGNWLELYASYKLNDITLILDDYFFFNAADSTNNFFDYSQKKTQHLIEARLEYENDFLKTMIGYVVYSNNEDNTNGVYLEATYKSSEKLSFTLGYLTAPQWLSFYEAGGLTSFSINGHKKLNILKHELPIKASLGLNPNYKNASPMVGNNPVYFVLSTEF